MPDPETNEVKQRTRSALRRWIAPARSAERAGLLLQLVALAGWIAIAWGIGQSVGAASQGALDSTGLLVAGFGVTARTVALWASDTMLARAGRAMVTAARREVFETLNQSGAGWLGGADTGSRTSQIIDRTAKLAGYAERWRPGMMFAAIGPFIVLAAIAMQTWLAAALLLVCLLAAPIFLWLTISETASRARTQQAALDSLSGQFQSRAAQSGLIRAFRAVRRETAQLQAASDRLREGTMAILRVAFLSTAVLEFFASISIALVAVYVGFKLLGVFPFKTGETLTLSEGLTALILAPEFFAPIRKLPGLHHDRADGTAAAELLSEWIARSDRQTIRRLPLITSAPAICFEHASLGWPGHAPVLNDLNFEAHPGQLTVLSGPSGSGKSTCLLSLIGRARLSDGAIRIDGTTLRDGDSLADSVAFVGQTPWLMEGTIRQNIAIAAPLASDEAIRKAAEQAGILDFAGKAEGGLDRRLSRFGGGLSGGQRQRIALARALLRGSPILLMDEPTAHLDPDAEEDFIRQIRSLVSQCTVLLASHSPALIEAADTVVELQPAKPEHAARC